MAITPSRIITTVVCAIVFQSSPALALERLCDPSTDNCRTAVLNLIKNERTAIDVGFWFMTDARYVSALIERYRAGVPVRVVMDTEGENSAAGNQNSLDQLAAAGIPMREKTAGGIMHWKMMLFAGQHVVEFGSANYSPASFVPYDPYRNYVDESVYMTDEAAIVDSFATVFDDVWTTREGYSDYANITSPTQRRYPATSIAPELSFPPYDDFGARLADAIAAETTEIDGIIFRVTDARVTDALIAAVKRGVTVRLIAEGREYRDASRLWIAWNLDRLRAGGVEVRIRAHDGLTHEKLAIFRGSGLTVFGSSNWTPESATEQLEHDYFTQKDWIRTWFIDQFERKWSNTTGVVETTTFTPKAPGGATLRFPASGATTDTVQETLRWYGGPWAHYYDVYVGTSSSTMTAVATNLLLGPSTNGDVEQAFTLDGLQPDTQYSWRIVSKTGAGLTATSAAWSFRTGTAPPPTRTDDPPPPPPADGGDPPPPAPEQPDVVLYAAQAAVRVGAWQRTDDATAAGGARVWQPDAGAAKVTTASADPANYFDLEFSAPAGVPFRIWMRGKADRDSWSNDSVFVQFSDGVLADGTPQFRIGTTSAAVVSVEDCSGCGLAGWGWADDAYGKGALGPTVTFATDGPHTLRVQSREDGVSIDQLVLSPQRYATTAPGQVKRDSTILPAAGGVNEPPADAPADPPPPEPAPGETSTSDSDGTIVAHAAGAAVAGAWLIVDDASAADGKALLLKDASRPKVSTAAASPADYAELTMMVEANTPYRVWLRGRAQHDNWNNDSVLVQFTDSVDEHGAPAWRIGTSSALSMILEECSGCGISGWGWQDDGWGAQGALGPLVMFDSAGAKTIRIQNREDGLAIDQIVLSPSRYLSAAPGPAKDDRTILPAQP